MKRVRNLLFPSACARAWGLLLPLLAACDGSMGAPLGGAQDGAVRPRDAGSRDATVPIDAGPLCELTSATETQLDSGLTVLHKNGQSRIAWRDRAEGAAGADYRYRVYRAATPLRSDADLATAQLVARNILHHSGLLFHHTTRPEHRVDPEHEAMVLDEGRDTLPRWSGLWATTAPRNGCAYFAVVATDRDDQPVESIEAGRNATVEPIAEQVGPLLPIKVFDSAERGAPNTAITGTEGLPLQVRLHGSGSPMSLFGDHYEFFGDARMGHQDGMRGVFRVYQARGDHPRISLNPWDRHSKFDGSQPVETRWFGYLAEPADGRPRAVYPFTEDRLKWIIAWAVERYRVDTNQIYGDGGSMGAWGSMSFSFRHPETFAAVFPDRPRFRQAGVQTFAGRPTGEETLPWGQRWEEYNDSVRFAREHKEDLPFVGWNVGRNDGFATWQEQVDMIHAMTESRHGFAFSWNDGGHGEGSRAKKAIEQWYPWWKFALDLSYPAFSNSSIDDDPGTGDPDDGDLVGGINLGFDWTVLEDQPGSWVVQLSNGLATAPMSVDVTPRRAQRFRPDPGTSIDFETSSGQRGTLVTDASGLSTVEGVRLSPNSETTLTLSPR